MDQPREAVGTSYDVPGMSGFDDGGYGALKHRPQCLISLTRLTSSPLLGAPFRTHMICQEENW